MLGMHGTYTANMAMAKAELIVSIGARFDDRVTGKLDEFAKHATIVHVDVDPASVNKNVKVDVPIVGDARTVHQADARGAPERRPPPRARSGGRRCATGRETSRSRYRQKRQASSCPRRSCRSSRG